MTKNMLIRALAGVLVVLGAGMSADAGTLKIFDFNSLASGTPSTSTKTGNYDSIQNYMNYVLGCKGCVTVSGAVADKTYNGDGRVTGPGSSKASTSLTLATAPDGATASNWNSALNPIDPKTGKVTTDTFIANTSDGSSQISQEIIIKFSGFTINGTVSFDYEIFPDGSCTSLTFSGCGGKPNKAGIYPNQPDLTFAVNGNVNTPVFVTYGVTPGTTNGNAKHSPVSGSKAELAPQYIGTWSGTLTNVNELDFVDWPATIGVDNLSYQTPEPSVIELCAILLGGALFFRRRLVALAEGFSDSV